MNTNASRNNRIIFNIYGTQFYRLQEILNQEKEKLIKDLTEEDLHYIFDTSSFKYSLVVNMFRHAGEKNKTDADIINICKTDENWVYKNYWTKKERASFLKKIILSATIIPTIKTK